MPLTDSLRTYIRANPDATAAEATLNSGWRERLPVFTDVTDSPTARTSYAAIQAVAAGDSFLGGIFTNWQAGGRPKISLEVAQALLTIAGSIQDAEAAQSFAGYVRTEPAATDASIAEAKQANAVEDQRTADLNALTQAHNAAITVISNGGTLAEAVAAFNAEVE